MVPGWREVCGPQAPGDQAPSAESQQVVPGHRGGWKALLEVWWDGPGQTGQERPVPEVRWLLRGPGTPWASFRCGLRCCHVSPAEAIPSPTLGVQGDLPESSWGCWPRGAGPAGQGLCGGGATPGLGSHLRPPICPLLLFPLRLSSALTLTLGVPLEGMQSPLLLQLPPVLLSHPLCSADRPGDPRDRRPETPGPPRPADTAAT